MNEDVKIALVARQAASRLSSGFGRNLSDAVEHTLAADPLDRPANKVLDPISIGAVIVSAAALGWTIFHDLKKDRNEAKEEEAHEKSSELLADELRHHWAEIARGDATITREQQDRVLMAVATEIVTVDASTSRR
jgi:hypothetical protein